MATSLSQVGAKINSSQVVDLAGMMDVYTIATVNDVQYLCFLHFVLQCARGQGSSADCLLKSWLFRNEFEFLVLFEHTNDSIAVGISLTNKKIFCPK